MNPYKREIPEMVLANLKRKRENSSSSEDEFVMFREDDDSSDSDEVISSSYQKKRKDNGDEDKHDSQWNDRFERLKQFKEVHGHLYVPRKTEKQLNRWCITQRAYKRDNKLSRERVQKLNSIGFQWGRSDSRQTEWDKQFEKMKLFIERHGHSSVPVNKDKKLNKWVEKQRASRKNGCMGEDRVRRLEAIGFQWQGRDFSKDWQHNFELLRTFWECHGHVDCSAALPEVSKWLSYQISLFKKGVLSVEKAKKLESVGISWFELDEKDWHAYFSALQDFRRMFGHCNVPENAELYGWCCQQRDLKRLGKLKQDRLAKLQQIGFACEKDSADVESSPKSSSPIGSPIQSNIDYEWLEKFRMLERSLRSDSGFGFPMIEKDLYFWLRKQLQAKDAGDLGYEQLRMLDTLSLWKNLVGERSAQGFEVSACAQTTL